jgi:glycosyltransferase involved in cell wall biosynthesis
MASNGVTIALVIEKCDDPLAISHPNITVIPQREKNKWLRPFELSRLLFKLNRDGYSHIFIRISWIAAWVSILTSIVTKQKHHYWLSGQGSFEHYESLPYGFSKLKFWITSQLPFFFIKLFIYRFVTGPESMKDYFIEKGNVSPAKISILYNDIDLSRFSQPDIMDKNRCRKVLNLPEFTQIIFFAHRFSPVRRTLFYLPYIIEKVMSGTSQKFMLVIAGGGPEEEALRAVISKSPARDLCQFVGNVPNAQIQHYYKAADIFINPTYAEGFPRVLIEAMASGLPVVTTNAGGIKDILGVKQSAYMTDKDDRETFSDKILQLLHSSTERDILSNENIHTVQRFSTESVAKMYITSIFEINNAK